MSTNTIQILKGLREKIDILASAYGGLTGISADGVKLIRSEIEILILEQERLLPQPSDLKRGCVATRITKECNINSKLCKEGNCPKGKDYYNRCYGVGPGCLPASMIEPGVVGETNSRGV